MPEKIVNARAGFDTTMKVAGRQLEIELESFRNFFCFRLQTLIPAEDIAEISTFDLRLSPALASNFNRPTTKNPNETPPALPHHVLFHDDDDCWIR